MMSNMICGMLKGFIKCRHFWLCSIKYTLNNLGNQLQVSTEYT